MIAVTQNEREEIRAIFARFLPSAKIRVFGSRAGGQNRPASDLDLAARDQTPIPKETLSRIKDAFETSGLPYSVDVIDYARASDSFQKIIDKTGLDL
ncbi:MAG: nucleotidyltransferase domain-containing protein [Opitutaceae bacterium]|jgi:type I restriction enzyme S subunit|nr:nucleotidyltransferase domain-containing protein [Opitutaceae bacterium]